MKAFMSACRARIPSAAPSASAMPPWWTSRARNAIYPLQHISEKQGCFEVIDSLLSEEAVLGFEYGYSTAEPKALVLWEAQFGDFANGAQVVMDQFIASGEMKWLRMSGLTLLLPHGYEGQGPEHSSARLERYLQLCAQDNMQVCVPTTPANYFHILRRQMHRSFRKPLIVLTPKSLLRNKKCTSFLTDMLPGTSFHRVLRDQAEVVPGATTIQLVPDDQIKRVVLCSGKVYFDLMEEREKRGENRIQILRIEQLYPFPENVLAQELNRFPKAELVWCQEEPQNQGAWNFVKPRIEATVAKLGGKASPALCGPARICLHRRRPDEAASGRTGRFPQRRPFTLRVPNDHRNQSARDGRVRHRSHHLQMVQEGRRCGEAGRAAAGAGDRQGHGGSALARRWRD